MLLLRFKLATIADKCLAYRYKYLYNMGLGAGQWCSVFRGHFTFGQTAVYAR
jgi:hypothetical protein